MTRKSFYCEKCKRKITYRKGNQQSAVSRHYKKHHPRVKKRKKYKYKPEPTKRIGFWGRKYKAVKTIRKDRTKINALAKEYEKAGYWTEVGIGGIGTDPKAHYYTLYVHKKKS